MDTTHSVRTRFDGRYGNQHGSHYQRYTFDDPTPEKLKELILDSTPPGEPWGEATFTFKSDGPVREMYLLSHPELGYFLRHGDLRDSNGLLSCWNRDLLSTVECPDDIAISAGLFVPPSVAYAAILEFRLSGHATPEIEWITPAQIPPDGNYV